MPPREANSKQPAWANHSREGSCVSWEMQVGRLGEPTSLTLDTGLK